MARLIDYFDKIRRTTQLILVTHQRRTMEAADVLYGVSMQAAGVSKLVSQRLDQALRRVGYSESEIEASQRAQSAQSTQSAQDTNDSQNANSGTLDNKPRTIYLEA